MYSTSLVVPKDIQTFFLSCKLFLFGKVVIFKFPIKQNIKRLQRSDFKARVKPMTKRKVDYVVILSEQLVRVLFTS